MLCFTQHLNATFPLLREGVKSKVVMSFFFSPFLRTGVSLLLRAITDLHKGALRWCYLWGNGYFPTLYVLLIMLK